VNPDIRGWRIALTPEALLNPSRAGLPDVLGVLEKSGYGVLQLPGEGDHRLLLAVIADQVEEYSQHGYAVVAIGVQGEPGNGLHWRRLAPLLRHRALLRNRQTALPPRHIIKPDVDAMAETQRLATWLDNYDLPVEEQRRWR
jgi:hypothetical protein